MMKSVKQIAQETVAEFDCIDTFKGVNGMTTAELAIYFFELGYARAKSDIVASSQITQFSSVPFYFHDAEGRN